MRALAEFVMRGRGQAIAVASVGVITVLFSWVSAAVVGLVTLRRGTSDGLIVLGWTLLPALAMALWGGDIGPAGALIGTAIAAAVLRLSMSWSYALVAAVAVGLVTAVLLQTVGAAYVQQLLALLGDFFEQLRRQMATEHGIQLSAPVAAQVSGLLGFGTTCSTVLALLLARWWQSLLYNPGGFREEFHQLRLAPLLAAALIGAGLLVSLLGADYRLWALLFAVPLTVAGFALVHGVAAQRQWGRGVLVLVYIAWFFADAAKGALLLAAVVDSWWDIRRRLAQSPR